MELREAIDVMLAANKHEKVLLDFVMDRFKEKKSEFFKANRTPGLFYIYTSYEIIDTNTIEIHYEYGCGDYSYLESFTVDVRPYIREEKIENLKSKS